MNNGGTLSFTFPLSISPVKPFPNALSRKEFILFSTTLLSLMRKVRGNQEFGD